MELVYIKNDVRRDEAGKIICKYNSECRCERLACGKCGWNPKVADQRIDNFMRKGKAVLA